MTVAKKAVPKELLDSLLADYRKPEDLIGANGFLKHLTKILADCCVCLSNVSPAKSVSAAVLEQRMQLPAITTVAY